MDPFHGLRIAVTGGTFTDPSPFEPHNARVYRFAIPG